MAGEIKNAELNKVLNIFISAGEESGELHGAELLEEIKKQSAGSKVEIWGLGGSKMEEAGANILFFTNELSTIGFIDVVKKLNFFRKVLRDSLAKVREIKPDCVILIDYPGFNLKFAQKLREFYKGNIFYYISPQLWAWNEKRVYKIKKFINKVLVVFLFEKAFYEKFNVDAVYVGHPLTKRIKNFLDNNEKRKEVYGEEKTISILPGSRKDEINNHLPILLQTAKQLSKEFDLKVNISKSKGVSDNVFRKFESDLKSFNLTDENSYKLIQNSDLVLTKAGTSTVECALLGTPFIIFYKTSPVNYHLFKPFVKVDKLGMVNILAKENIVREFIQNDFNEQNLLNESRKILTEIDYRNKMTDNLKNIWNILGKDDASVNAAKIILSSIKHTEN